MFRLKTAFLDRTRGIIIVMLCGLLPTIASAQEVTIRGRVRSAEGNVIRFADISVRDSDGDKVSTAPKYEDEGESFSVRVPAKLGKVSVLFENRPFHHPHLL